MEIKPQEKMNIREIRIGNIIEYLTVQNPDTWDQILVSPVTFGRLSMESTRFRGIDLTPEWLEKFGFENKSRPETWIFYKELVFGQRLCIAGLKKNEGFSLNEMHRPTKEEFEEGYDIVSINEIKTVHSLQNLYFALTGNELVIDNKSL